MANPYKDCGSAECLAPTMIDYGMQGTREFSVADRLTANIECLKRQLAAAKAELAILKNPEAKWYSYWHEDRNGYELHDTAEEAKAAAEDSIDDYRDESWGSEWSDEVEYVEWGLMVPYERAKAVPDEDNQDCYDYELAPLLDAAKGAT